MNREERSPLSDEQMLFTLLTALVKRGGGEIRISEQEMDGIAKKDMVAMYYDRENKMIILTTHLLHSPDFRNTPDEVN